MSEWIPSNIFMFQKKRSNKKTSKSIGEIVILFKKWAIYLEYLHNTFVFTFIVVTEWKTFHATFTTLTTSSFTRACICLIYIVNSTDGSFNCQFGINLSSLFTHPHNTGFSCITFFSSSFHSQPLWRAAHLMCSNKPDLESDNNLRLQFGVFRG